MSLTYPQIDKPKTHCILSWGEISEPYCNMHTHPEVQLAIVEHLMESSRPYRSPGRWGAHGVTGLLNHSSGATNQHERGWFLPGNLDWDGIRNRCKSTINTAMLTRRHDAEIWREQQGIAPDKKVRLQGPIAGDYQDCRKAWTRLQSFHGKKIIPLNTCHRRATLLIFQGIALQAPYHVPEMFGTKNPTGEWKKPTRSWKMNFDVGLDSSSWDLDFLCDDRDSNPNRKTPKWYNPPEGISQFKWHRQKKETLTQWFDRTSDFLESLLQKK